MLAAVLTRAIPWSALPASTPAGVRRLLVRLECHAGNALDCFLGLDPESETDDREANHDAEEQKKAK